MPKYKVNISDGVFEFVDADTEDEARINLDRAKMVQANRS